MGLIDSHAHLTFPELSNRVDDVLTNCGDAGVDGIITVSIDLADARRAVELAKRYPTRIRAAVGFHPHEAGKVGDADLAELAKLWNDPSVVACGEMGLDYYYDLSDRAVQRSVFARQLELATDCGKPIVIHAREAFDDVASMLRDQGYVARRVVFHCFTGTEEQAAKIAEHGWRISFTGIVTFPQAGELQAIARTYPTDKLMIETDAPYLSPVPVRGKRPNEPAYLAHTAKFLAELRGVPYERLVADTGAGTRSFFNW